MVRTTLPGASVEEVETPDLRRPRRGGQPRRGHQRAALGLGAGPVDVERHVQPRSRHRHRGAGRARPRRLGAAPAARTTSSRRSSSSRTATTRRSLSIALSGNLSIRELTEIADKIVKVPLERVAGRRRGADRRRPRARDQHLGRGRSARRLPAADHRGARRAAAAERRPARRQRHRPTSTSARCARWAASPTPSSSTTWSSPRATARRSASATSAAPRTAPRSSARSRG